ncbi:MAG: class I SAM-dependent methyltransferase [Betaproteobacteria bacterium]|nr:class I SAM-dependent methyltransferase [Betaproteobacteria bacterium]MDH5222453.1 class I SAM-dependent methyltransferase [Betaproteobacteria bacterium]MDH5350230.1 class I SAM-dependent methyltransferase [Betaproteobacteria bacterium]
MSAAAQYARLVEAASAPYRAAGSFAWHFARGKLGRDPAFRHFLEARLIPEGARLLDLGCGQGLLRALLDAAGEPRLASYRGFELMARDVERARRALGGDCGVSQGDIRTAPFGSADVVVLLDVLHYLPLADQDAVLARVRAALAPGGTLLLRIGDAGGGLPFLLSNWADWCVACARGHGATRFHCRSVAQWRGALEALGFAVRAEPMSRGTPFANVLLVARAPRHD